MEKSNLSFKTAFKIFLTEYSSTTTDDTKNEVSTEFNEEKDKPTQNADKNGNHNSRDNSLSAELFHKLEISKPITEKFGNPKEKIQKSEQFCKIFVANLDDKTDERELHYYFRKYNIAALKNCIIVHDPETRRSKCIGCLIFDQTHVSNILVDAPFLIADKYVSLFRCQKGGTEPEEFRKVLIKNLNFKTSEEDLENYLKQWGEIESCIIIKNEENLSKGYGYVTFKSFEMMNEVIINGPHRFQGRTLKFDVFIQPSAELECDRKIILKYMSLDTTDVSLQNYFEKFGKLESSVIMKERISRKSRGSGYVIFQHAYMRDTAMTKRNHIIDYRRVIFSIPESNSTEPEYKRKLFISNLNPETEEDYLIYYFDQFGKVESCVIARKENTRRSLCYGYVLFECSRMVADAMACGPHKVHFYKLLLSLSQPAEQKVCATYKSKDSRYYINKKVTKKNWNKGKHNNSKGEHYFLNDFDGAGVNIFQNKNQVAVEKKPEKLSKPTINTIQENIPEDPADHLPRSLNISYRINPEIIRQCMSETDIWDI